MCVVVGSADELLPAIAGGVAGSAANALISDSLNGVSSGVSSVESTRWATGGAIGGTGGWLVMGNVSTGLLGTTGGLATGSAFVVDANSSLLRIQLTPLRTAVVIRNPARSISAMGQM